MVRRATVVALIVFTIVPLRAAAKEHIVRINDHEVKVKITESIDQTSMIIAECIIPRTQRVVWKVLSDYDNLENVIPAVYVSRIVRKEGVEKILYQEGSAGLWFLKRNFTVTFRVEELPMSYIGFDAFEGDFKKFKGSWQIAPREEGTLINHRVEIEPRFFAPKWALRLIARKLMFETIDHVVDRCMVVETP